MRINHKHQSGFTLTEVLLALGIFTIGFSMMAMALPIAALMQKNTSDGVLNDIVKVHAQSIISSSQFRLGDWSVNGQSFIGLDSTGFPLVDSTADFSHQENLAIKPFPYATLEEQESFSLLNRPETRSYPMNDPSPKLYWVPFIKREIVNEPGVLGINQSWKHPDHDWFTTDDQWQMYIAVLKYRPLARYDRTIGNWAYDNTTQQNIPGMVWVDIDAVDPASSEFKFENNFHTDIEGPDLKKGHKIVDELGNVFVVKKVEDETVQVEGDIPYVDELLYKDPETKVSAGRNRRMWYSPGGIDGGDSPILDIFIIQSNDVNRFVLDNKKTEGAGLAN